MITIPTKYVPLLKWFGDNLAVDGSTLIAYDSEGYRVATVSTDIPSQAPFSMSDVQYTDLGGGESAAIGTVGPPHVQWQQINNRINEATLCTRQDWPPLLTYWYPYNKQTIILHPAHMWFQGNVAAYPSETGSYTPLPPAQLIEQGG